MSKIKYYLEDEVVIHNKSDDFWIIINKIVYNLTPLIKDRQDTMNDALRLLLCYGGKDISVFFDKNNVPLPTVTLFKGEAPCYFKPGHEVAFSHLSKTPGLEWWEDDFYIIGRITERERTVRVINSLTASIIPMKVCEEDTIQEIIEKFRKRYNSHVGSYICRKYYKKMNYRLKLNATLTENGMHHKDGPNSLWLYFVDDFTVS